MGAFEIFARATSAHGFEAARQLLKSKDLGELYAKIEVAYNSPQLAQFLQSEWPLRLSVGDLLNIREIARQIGLS